MKPLKPTFETVAMTVCALALWHPDLAVAANQSWNPGGSGGGAGSWNTGNWDAGLAWNSGNTALFSGAAGGITLNSTNQTVGGLTFSTGGYALSSGTLSFSGLPTTITTNGGTTTFASTLALTGAAGAQITKTGSGVLALNAANGSLGTAASNSVWTITGGTLSNGVFDSVVTTTGGNNLGALPAAGGAVQAILDQGTLILGGASSAGRWIQVNAAGGTLLVNGNFAVDGKILNNADSTHTLYVGDGAGFAGSFTGIVSGTGSLTKIDAGTLSLTGANTYSGGTTLSAGTLTVGNATALGASTGALTVAGGLLNLNGNSITVGTLSGTGGILSTGTAAGTSTLTVNSNANGTFAGAINNNGSGLVALVKSGTGTLSLSGSNSHSAGTAIQGGAIQLTGADNRLAAGGSVTLGGVATSGKLILGGTAGAINQTLAGLLKTGNGGSVVGGNSAVSTLTLNVASGTNPYGGSLGGAGTHENNLALTKSGVGVLTLAAGNTFTGGVMINGGTLGIFEGNSLGAATSPATTFAANSSLRFEQTPSGNVSNLRNFLINPGVTATMDTQNFNAVVDSLISGSGGVLTKSGAGSLTLTGSNTYTGGTNLNAGILVAGGSTALGLAGTISFGGGTLQYSSSNQTDYSPRFSTAANQSYKVDTNGQTVTWATALTSSGATLTKSGSGTLIIGFNSTPNTFTGGVTLNSGTLGISQGNSLGALPGSPTTQLTFAGNSTLQFQIANPTALNANRQFLITSGVTGTIDTQSFTVAIGGAVGGAGGVLSKIGSGTLILNGTNTYGGGTVINAGTVQLGNANSLGATSGALTVNGGTLNLNGNSVTVGTLTGTGGSFTGFNVGASSNTLAVSSTSMPGTSYIGINGATLGGTGTYNLITSSGGGLGSATFQFAGAQNLTVPVSSMIAKSGSNYYRMTLNNTGSAEQLIVSDSVPGNVMSIMPLGASITAGYSPETNYGGGGYRTQLNQNIVNDGRFTPNFVGSSTTYLNPLLATAGQVSHEGHFGYTTNHILDNLNANSGSAGNNGGFWLAPGNGVNPNYIPLNVGGNDGGGATPDQAVNRLDAIVSQLNTLRPGVDTIVSNLPYRSDVGAFVTGTYNPNVPSMVYNHVLAGQNVQFLDLYTLITPGNSLANISSDGVHPTQAGYHLIANAFTNSILTGAAYWTGSQNTDWGSVTGNSTNWAMDAARTTDRQTAIDGSTDVYFNNAAAPQAVSLTQDSALRSLNFTGAAAASVTVSGSNRLLLGSGGITVQQGTGAHTVAANIDLSADQTWGNVSANDLTVAGVVSGSNSLTIAGSATLYTGTSSTLALQTISGTGAIVLAGNNTYTGSTTIQSSGKLQIGSGGTTGSISTSSTITNHGSLTIDRSNAVVQGADFTGSAIVGSGSLSQTGSGTTTLNAANTYAGGTTVSNGSLMVNNTQGSGTGTGYVSVSAGARLGGNGAIAGPVNISTGGLLAPGNPTGSMTFNAGLTLAGTYLWDLGALSTSNPGDDFDRITITAGNADITGAAFGLQLGTLVPSEAGFWQVNQTWSGILNNTGDGTLTGNFAPIDNSAWSTLGSFTTSNTANDVSLVWTAIPESGTATLFGFFLSASLLRRRRA